MCNFLLTFPDLKDRSVVCIVGQGIFKMCRLTEGVLKQFGFQKAEHHSMVCHDWIGARHVLIGENKAFLN